MLVIKQYNKNTNNYSTIISVENFRDIDNYNMGIIGTLNFYLYYEVLNSLEIEMEHLIESEEFDLLHNFCLSQKIYIEINSEHFKFSIGNLNNGIEDRTKIYYNKTIEDSFKSLEPSFREYINRLGKLHRTTTHNFTGTIKTLKNSNIIYIR